MKVQVASPNQLVVRAFQKFPKVWGCKSEYEGAGSSLVACEIGI